MHTQVQTAISSKMRQIGTILFVAGATGTAACVLWWLMFHGETVSPSSLGALVECLLRTTKECDRRQMITTLGLPAYQQMLLWVSSAVFLAGTTMNVLAPAAAPTRRTAGLTWQCVVSVWWLLVWRGTFGYMVLGVILGLAVDYMAADWSPLQIARATSVAVAAFGIVWLIPVVSMALAKRYNDFQLVLTLPGGSAPLSITGRRVLAIWWLLIWRFTFGGIVFGLVAAWLMLAAVVLRGLPMPPLIPWVMTGASVATFIWSAGVTRIAIDTTYSDFRIAIVPRMPI